MVTKVYYEKVGGRYKPVSEYDSNLIDSFGKGSHLVICYPGGQSRRYNIDPDYAALIAAARVAEDAMIQAMHKASELKPKQTPITEGQRKAWKKLAREFGDELATLNGASSYDIAQAGLKALEQEAANLLTNEAVKAAYDQFLFVCALTKQQRK
jgi:ABC-type branched-subunit amino acid transport system substrate-binding protein